MILVGDIGGTNARLALAKAEGSGFALQHLQRYPTPEDLPALLRNYLGEFHGQPPSAAAICGAGPMRDDGSIALTNHPSVLEPSALAEALGLDRVSLVNDFEAVAHAIPVLAANDLRACGGGKGDARAPKLVIGPGTGLGVASLVPVDGDWMALPGEGGHVDLAPVSDEELAIWQLLREQHGPLSAESLLCGTGYERLYAAVSGVATLAAEDIAGAAAKGDKDSLRASHFFTRWLGRVAGNAALTVGARGGVYIAGGIVPAWGALFDVEIFREGFEDKQGYRDWLRQIPGFVLIHPEPTLIGLARLALKADSTKLAGPLP